MKDIFLNTDYTSMMQVLIRVLAFFALNGLILYTIYLILIRVLFRRSTHRREITLRLTFLWAIFTYFVLFNVYIFTLFHVNGIDSMHWASPLFYLGASGQLVIYTGLIALFFAKRQALKRIINDNSIN